MAMKKLLGGMVLAVALAACGGSGNADLDKFMKLDSDKAVAFSAGGDDCAAKAKTVGEWRTKHSAEYKALQKKLNDQWPDGPPKDIKEKYGDKMKANKKAVIDAMFACSNDETFGKMMDDTKAGD
jgi:hypothetical protein